MIGLSQGRKAFRIGKAALLAGLTVTAVAGTNLAAHAQLIYGFTTTNRLFSFNSSTPATTLSNVAITGVTGTLLDIDFRPANGLLYGVSFNAGLFVYTINTTTGAATLLTASGVGSAAADYDIDFNPVADALRIIGSNGDNFRVTNLNSTGSFNTDTPLNGAATTGIVGTAYTNNFPGAPSTQQFYIGNGGQLYTTAAPNGGTLTTVGAPSPALGTTPLGFDIFGANTAYVVAANTLYSENLATGAATSLGAITSPGGTIRGIAVSAAPEPGSFVLLGTGLVSMGGIAVRRRKAKKA